MSDDFCLIHGYGYMKSDGGPVHHCSRCEKVRRIVADVLRYHASPTVDRGDAHGARGQSGWIVWASSIGHIASAIAREVDGTMKPEMTSPTDPQVPSDQRREEIESLWIAHEAGRRFEGFWSFIAALDAQSAERTRAEVDQLKADLDRSITIGNNLQGEVKILWRRFSEARAEVEKMREAAATHLHVKSGHEVSLVAQGRMQTALPMEDMTAVTIYRHDGNWWVRPTSEFEDGRFRAIEGTSR